mgnify:CR=1 FL=1
MSFECQKCGSLTRVQVLASISAPGELSHQFSKSNLRRADVWLMGVNWETADYICTNDMCRHVTNGYGNYVTRLKNEREGLIEKAEDYLEKCGKNGLSMDAHEARKALRAYIDEVKA